MCNARPGTEGEGVFRKRGEQFYLHVYMYFRQLDLLPSLALPVSGVWSAF